MRGKSYIDTPAEPRQGCAGFLPTKNHLTFFYLPHREPLAHNFGVEAVWLKTPLLP